MHYKILTLLSVLLISASGCTLCCAPFDYDYNAFGGKYDRIDRVNNRVGSAFAPAEGNSNSDRALGEPPVDLAKGNSEVAEGEETERVANRKIGRPLNRRNYRNRAASATEELDQANSYYE